MINAPADLLKPVFGICLGNQLLALAAGAQTEKLPFGNRGQNQPVINNITGDCYITPQNHGYAVNDLTLPPGWKVLMSPNILVHHMSPNMLVRLTLIPTLI